MRSTTSWAMGFLSPFTRRHLRLLLHRKGLRRSETRLRCLFGFVVRRLATLLLTCWLKNVSYWNSKAGRALDIGT